MVLQPKDLGGEVTSFDGSIRMYVKDNKAVKLAGHGVADTELPAGTPLAEDGVTAGLYNTWTDGDDIACFLQYKHTQLNAGETLAVVMLAGDIHYADVPLPTGQTQNALDTALKAAALGEKGIRVQGLADVSL